MTENLAPIILFVYNRPWHTQQTLEALASNKLAKDSMLYIYADGAKENAIEQDLQKIKEVREIISTFEGCKEIHITTREKNWGLADNIIDGVTKIVNQYDKIIVLEDDLITSPFFLDFMNQGLVAYKNSPKVWSIGACNFFSTKNHTPETFFIPIPDCWGWATWKDRWQYFETDSSKLLQKLIDKNLVDSFNLYGNYPFIDMLKAQAEGKISSWAIRWQAQAYLHEALALYPKYPLTEHIESNNATHASNFSTKVIELFPEKFIEVNRQEIKSNKKVIEDMHKGYSQIQQKLTTNFNSTHLSKLKKVIQLLLPPLFIKIYTKLFKSKKSESITFTTNTNSINWLGNYLSWEDAKSNCTGYNSDSILNKVLEATLKVKNGEAVYERDSVVFDKIEYNWSLLATLLNIAISNQNKLFIIDFGGALGSTYFQNRNFLNNLEIDWTVVEQELFVEKGKKYIQNEELSFCYSIEEARSQNNASVLLLSGVIQYLDEPYKWIEKFLSYDFEYIIIDRTAFIQQTNLNDKSERLTIQYVPKTIYEASYPTWFFNEEKFTEKFTEKYELITDYKQTIEDSIKFEDNSKGYWNGFLFKIK